MSKTNVFHYSKRTTVKKNGSLLILMLARKVSEVPMAMLECPTAAS